MCGICGYVDTQTEGTVLPTMVRSLKHRGPDGAGHWMNQAAALGHRRLSIIDLSDAANQPMRTPDGRYVIVFNGEIYNYRELRRELQRAGETFQSYSDTEVLLIGYRRWGRQILDRLRGMFAFGVWDDRRRLLFLARDRIGIKPLFYAPVKSGIVFASEIKALFKHPGVGQELNHSALDTYFELGYIPGPATIFHGIRALMPGCWLEYHAGGLQTQRYWEPDFSHANLDTSEEELIDELDQQLNDAVKSHLVADVPVGAFLSGGIDSSLICAIAQRYCDEPLQTFTIGFGGAEDERTFAQAVASHIGSRHHEHLITPDIVEQLPRLVRYLDQPLFDNSTLPTYLISEHASARVKVVLSGDGGDEPFGGYDWTRFALTLPGFSLKWQPSGWQWAYRKGSAGLLQRLIYDLANSENERYQRRVAVSEALRAWLYQPEFLRRIGDTLSLSTGNMLRRAPVSDERDRFMYADLCRYLPEDVLYKVDRMSMANSLEVRVPFLDHRLLEWILRLPFGLRFRHGRGKYLLRKLAARYLPSEVLKHRKQGFTVPLGRWLHGKLSDWVEDIFRSPSFRQRGIVRPEAALEMLAMHRSRRYELGHRIWSLVILEAWARVWLDGRHPDEVLHLQ